MTEVKEVDRTVSFKEQQKVSARSVVVINTFVTDPENVEELIDVWAAEARIMKLQPGFVSTQIHRGIAGSGACVNYAVWESVEAYNAAIKQLSIQGSGRNFPDGTTMSPHLYQTVQVEGVCLAWTS